MTLFSHIYIIDRPSFPLLHLQLRKLQPQHSSDCWWIHDVQLDWTSHTSCCCLVELIIFWWSWIAQVRSLSELPPWYPYHGFYPPDHLPRSCKPKNRSRSPQVLLWQKLVLQSNTFQLRHVVWLMVLLSHHKCSIHEWEVLSHRRSPHNIAIDLTTTCIEGVLPWQTSSCTFKTETRTGLCVEEMLELMGDFCKLATLPGNDHFSRIYWPWSIPLLHAVNYLFHW